MMKQEFEELVGLPVSQEEYDAIEIVYNNSDVDKYKFTDYWTKMNISRIDAYKKEQRRKEMKELVRLNVSNIIYKLTTCGRDKGFDAVASDFLTDSDKSFISQLGVLNYYETIRIVLMKLEAVLKRLQP